MRMIPKVLTTAIIAAAIGFSSVAIAAELTDEETAALEETVAGFDEAMKSGDYETVVGIVPPAVIENIATSAGIASDDLIVAMVEQTTQAMAAITLISFGMDMENAEYLETEDGTPYVLIPTETVMDTGAGGKIKAASPTLALMDEGEWYLLSVSDPNQVTILKQVYPSFAAVELPAGTMEKVE